MRKGFLLSFAVLASCNTGDDGVDNLLFDADPEGLWSGTFSLNGASVTVDAFVRGDDLLVFDVVGDLVLRGPVSVDGNTLTGSATLYQADGADVATAAEVVDFTGIVTERSSMTARFTTSEGLSGSFALTFDPGHEKDSSFTLISGIWSRTLDTATLTLTVADNGVIDGSDTAGCVYTGSVQIIDTDFNIYGMTVGISNCGLRNGLYTGYGEVQDTEVADDTLVMGFTNVLHADGETLTRQ